MEAVVTETLKDGLEDSADAEVKRYRISVNDLDIGMFVAELDRPWLDTPFILQGFLVSSDVELETIKKYCEAVFVDLELSKAEVAGAILQAASASNSDVEVIVLDGGPQAFNVHAVDDQLEGGSSSKQTVNRTEREVKARSDLKVSTQTRERFKQLLRANAYGVTTAKPKESTLAKLFSWLKPKQKGEEKPLVVSTRESVLKGLVDPNLKLRNYRTKQQIEAELPRARATFQKTESVINEFVSDLRTGKATQIREVQGAVIDIVDSMIENPDALIWIARLRDEDIRTYNHSVKVSLYLVAFGRHLGFPKEELAHLGMIGMLADVGKSKLPRALIDKPGMLSPSEFALVKEHVTIGLHALKKNMTLPSAVEQGIAQHHERMDGSGYPLGLKADQISIYGRMAAIVDCFSALITPRAYANPAAPQEALMNMLQWAGKAFHEPLLEQFVQAVGVFPIGSLVELSTGEVAVVVSHHRVKRLEPKVLILTGPDKVPYPKPKEFDLHRRVRDAQAKPIRIARGLPAGSYGLQLKDYYLSGINKSENSN